MVKAARPSRADYYRVLAKAVPAGTLVVTALGNASYLWAAMHHVPENFYVEDSMGLALPLALGLAVAQPSRPVVVVEGDGATLMHMGALVTVGAVKPANLTVLLIQNGVHAASGGQALTNPALDLAALARASGIGDAMNVATRKRLPQRLTKAPKVHACWCWRLLLTSKSFGRRSHSIRCSTKQRFMTAIGAPRYMPTLFGGGGLEGA